jgi:transketolase
MIDLHKVRDLRNDCLFMSYMMKDGNLQSAFSSLDIIYILYNKIMRLNGPNRDDFVLSKGQASLALYSVLADLNIISKAGLFATIGELDSKFGMQLDRTKFKNNEISVSTGSLGHGLPIACGMAYANKIKGLDGRIYCLIGDGELCEGTIWESLMFAYTKDLKNLTIIIDDNKSVQEMIDLDHLKDKLEAFGIVTFTCNGHDFEDLRITLNKYMGSQPTAIIARTFRGYGSPTLFNDKSWFHRAPKTKDEMYELMKEVNEFYER